MNVHSLQDESCKKFETYWNNDLIICPISGNPMVLPAICGEEQITYDFVNIIDYLYENNFVSPQNEDIKQTPIIEPNILFNFNTNKELINIRKNIASKFEFKNKSLYHIIRELEGSRVGLLITDYYGEPDKWNVSKVTNMSNLFKNCTNFNYDIQNWDVSNVVDMSSMFRNARNFNKPINTWNVSNVINMDNMFCDAKSFNKSISSWNINKINTSLMFNDKKQEKICKSKNKIKIKIKSNLKKRDIQVEAMFNRGLL